MKNIMFIAFAVALMTSIGATSDSFTMNNDYEIAAGGWDW